MATLFSNQDSLVSAPKFKNRNRMEIVADLLIIAKTGTLKTHLMYRANLSYVMIHDYLDYMEETGLIVKIKGPDGAKLYKTTEKGMRYIEVYTYLQELAGMNSKENSLPPPEHGFPFRK